MYNTLLNSAKNTAETLTTVLSHLLWNPSDLVPKAALNALSLTWAKALYDEVAVRRYISHSPIWIEGVLGDSLTIHKSWI